MGQKLFEGPRAEDRQQSIPSNLEVRFSNGTGIHKTIAVRLLNTGLAGLGFKAVEPLHVNSTVEILGKQNGLLIRQNATVRWSRPARSGGFRIGVRLIGKPVLSGIPNN